ncbi:MAG: SMI1/KNR4 family protein [Candidatus Hodarchaeota archaeon]
MRGFTLSEEVIIKFETRHKIKLPLDYMTFLMEIGNGGTGPYYGGFPLGEYDESAWKENDGFVGVLSKPFPYTSDWNNKSNFPN